jgi:hypothetical protein
VNVLRSIARKPSVAPAVSGGAHDASGFVDPDRLRHVHQVVQVRQVMVTVDQARIGRLRCLDPTDARRRGVSIATDSTMKPWA